MNEHQKPRSCTIMVVYVHVLTIVRYNGALELAGLNSRTNNLRRVTSVP